MYTEQVRREETVIYKYTKQVRREETRKKLGTNTYKLEKEKFSVQLMLCSNK